LTAEKTAPGQQLQSFPSKVSCRFYHAIAA